MSVHVVLAVGMQGCFLSEGGATFLGQPLKDSLLSYLSGALVERNTVVYSSRMIRHADDPLFSNDLSSCLPGSVDSESVCPEDSRVIKVVHSRPDVTSQQQFKSDLLRRDVDYVTIVGAESHGAVLHTAMSLSYLGYRVEVPVSMTESRDMYLKDSALSLLSLSCGVTLL